MKSFCQGLSRAGPVAGGKGAWPSGGSPWLLRLRWTLAALGLLCAMCIGSDLRAADRPGEALVAGCIARAARGQVWLERSLWGLRDQEAGWIGAAVANNNGSQDLGPLQVNSWWVPRIASLVGRPEGHVRHWLRHDACFNVEAARWIFLTGLAETREYWKAVGRYHSPTPWRQARYARSVALRLQKRFGRGIWRGRGAPRPMPPRGGVSPDRSGS